MKPPQLIESKHKFLEDLCQSHGVKALYLFGSSVSGGFDQLKSDIDLFVEIEAKDPLEKGEVLISLWDKLEKFFDRKIDLLTEDSVKNPYLKNSIMATRKLIYDGERKEILI